MDVISMRAAERQTSGYPKKDEIDQVDRILDQMQAYERQQIVENVRNSNLPQLATASVVETPESIVQQ